MCMKNILNQMLLNKIKFNVSMNQPFKCNKTSLFFQSLQLTQCIKIS